MGGESSKPAPPAPSARRPSLPLSSAGRSKNDAVRLAHGGELDAPDIDDPAVRARARRRLPRVRAPCSACRTSGPFTRAPRPWRTTWTRATSTRTATATKKAMTPAAWRRRRARPRARLLPCLGRLSAQRPLSRSWRRRRLRRQVCPARAQEPPSAVETLLSSGRPQSVRRRCSIAAARAQRRSPRRSRTCRLCRWRGLRRRSWCACRPSPSSKRTRARWSASTAAPSGPTSACRWCKTWSSFWLARTASTRLGTRARTRWRARCGWAPRIPRPAR